MLMNTSVEQLHLQVVAPLPPGPVVEQTVIESVARGSHPSGIPVPNSLSPRGVETLLSFDPVTEPLVGPVLAGLRDPEAVATLARHADENWLRWVVHLNPVSEHLSARDLPPTPSFDANLPSLAELDALPWVLLATLPNLPWLTRTAPEHLLNTHANLLAELCSDVYDTTWTDKFLPVPKSLLSTQVWDAWGLDYESMSLRNQPGKRREVIEQFKDFEKSSGRVFIGLHLLEALAAEDDPTHGDRIMRLFNDCLDLGGTGFAVPLLGGPGFMNAWLRGALAVEDHRIWRTLLLEGRKPVAGRFVGPQLLAAAGWDSGLWFTGLDMLTNWDGPLSEWLDAVAALT